MKVKRLLAVGLAALMMISAAGCGSKDNGAQEAGNANTPAPAAESSAAIGERHTADGRTQINVGWNYAITSLAPFQAESPAKNLLYSTAVFETLAKYDQDGIIQPSLAKEWTQIDEDGFVYEVRLFDYIKDSEGNPITADDVIFCIDQINKSGTQTAYYNKLDSVEKKDDYTLVFNMNSNEYGDFDMILNYCIVVSKDAFEKSGDEMATAIIATGPYKVTGFVNSSTVTIEKNENYWQTDDTLKQPYAAQNVDVIEVTCIPEESQQEVALETGSIDFMNEMAAHSIDQLAGYSGWNTASNAMGTVIAQLLSDVKADAPDTDFRNERFLDDLYYESLVRQQLNEYLRARGEDPYRLTDKDAAEAELRRLFDKLERPLLDHIGAFRVSLPWSRTFEVCAEVS